MNEDLGQSMAEGANDVGVTRSKLRLAEVEYLG